MFMISLGTQIVEMHLPNDNDFFSKKNTQTYSKSLNLNLESTIEQTHKANLNQFIETVYCDIQH